eukprot:5639930-Pleurochrysis_carterae.AAC.2
MALRLSISPGISCMGNDRRPVARPSVATDTIRQAAALLRCRRGQLSATVASCTTFSEADFGDLSVAQTISCARPWAVIWLGSDHPRRSGVSSLYGEGLLNFRLNFVPRYIYSTQLSAMQSSSRDRTARGLKAHSSVATSALQALEQAR